MKLMRLFIYNMQIYLFNISAILCLIGVTIFGVKQKQTHFGGVQELLDFSFYLCMGAGIGLFLVVIPIVVEIVRGRRLGYYESI